MKIKVALGVATAGTIKSKTAFSIIEMVRLNPEIELMPIFTFSGYIGENKNNQINNIRAFQKMVSSAKE